MPIDSNFKKLIANKDLLAIRVKLKNSLVTDPSFKEFNELFEYAVKKLPDIIEEHNGENLEISNAEITKDIIYGYAYDLAQNFSIERINFIKSISNIYYNINSVDKIDNVTSDIKSKKIIVKIICGAIILTAIVAGVVLILTKRNLL